MAEAVDHHCETVFRRFHILIFCGFVSWCKFVILETDLHSSGCSKLAVWFKKKEISTEDSEILGKTLVWLRNMSRECVSDACVHMSQSYVRMRDSLTHTYMCVTHTYICATHTYVYVMHTYCFLCSWARAERGWAHVKEAVSDCVQRVLWEPVPGGHRTVLQQGERRVS